MTYYYLDLVYTYDATTSTYELYILIYWRGMTGCYLTAYTTHSGVNTPVENRYTANDGTQFCSFARLSEGDTFEFYAPIGNPDYAKAVYTAANGTITATSEHNIQSSLYLKA